MSVLSKAESQYNKDIEARLNFFAKRLDFFNLVIIGVAIGIISIELGIAAGALATIFVFWRFNAALIKNRMKMIKFFWGMFWSREIYDNFDIVENSGEDISSPVEDPDKYVETSPEYDFRAHVMEVIKEHGDPEISMEECMRLMATRTLFYPIKNNLSADDIALTKELHGEPSTYDKIDTDEAYVEKLYTIPPHNSELCSQDFDPAESSKMTGMPFY